MTPTFPLELRPTQLPPIAYIEHKNWGRNIPPRTVVDWIVLHCMQSPDEALNRAERSARWMAGLAPGQEPPMASYHYGVDPDSIVQGVQEDRVAYGAPGANRLGIHIEHCGRAQQTRAEWLDEPGLKTLDLSAQLVGGNLTQRWSIPLIYVDAAGLVAGQRGITTHHQVSLAFPRPNAHFDPGPQFPIDLYLERARRYADRHLAVLA